MLIFLVPNGSHGNGSTLLVLLHLYTRWFSRELIFYRVMKINQQHLLLMIGTHIKMITFQISYFLVIIVLFLPLKKRHSNYYTICKVILYLPIDLPLGGYGSFYKQLADFEETQFCSQELIWKGHFFGDMETMCGISATGKILGFRQRNIGCFNIEGPFVKNWFALNSHILFLEPNILGTHGPQSEVFKFLGTCKQIWYHCSYYPGQRY